LIIPKIGPSWRFDDERCDECILFELIRGFDQN